MKLMFIIDNTPFQTMSDNNNNNNGAVEPNGAINAECTEEKAGGGDAKQDAPN